MFLISTGIIMSLWEIVPVGKMMAVGKMFFLVITPVQIIRQDHKMFFLEQMQVKIIHLPVIMYL